MRTTWRTQRDCIPFTQTYPLSPTWDGVSRLRNALQSGQGVYSPFRVSRDYHVSFQTSVDFLLRGVMKGYLAMIPGRLGIDAAFAPIAWRGTYAFGQQARRVRQEVGWHVKVLQSAYKSYVPGKPLREQGEDIHDSLLLAFRTLCRQGILPLTLGNVLIHHLNMVNFMAMCLQWDNTLVRYLRDPSLLQSR